MQYLTHITLTHYLTAAAVLFCLGVICVIARHSAIGILIGLEIMLNAANLNLIAFNRFCDSTALLSGQVFSLMVIILAACEVVIALAIIINIYRSFGTIDVDSANRLKQ
jgi:NADH-quinone oxidoreductase subunit K